MKNLMFFLIGMAVLAALFVYMKPEPPTAAPPADLSALPAAAPALPAPLPAAPQPQVFEFTFTKGQLFSGPDLISVKQGDEVILRVVSDQNDELHLHGYDLALPLKAGAQAELRFVADRSGRFEYELHEAHAGIGALEVQPKP